MRTSRGRGTRDDATAWEPPDGRGKAVGFPDVQQAVARLLEAAAGPATEEELSGGPAIVAAFVLAVNAAGPRPGEQGLFPGGRRAIGRVPVLVAGIAMAVGVAIGGTATAGALPPRIQEIAHTAFGAPAPRYHGDGDPRAAAKTAHSATKPERVRPGKPHAPMPGKATSPGKAKGHLKTHAARTRLKRIPGRKDESQSITLFAHSAQNWLHVFGFDSPERGRSQPRARSRGEMAGLIPVAGSTLYGWKPPYRPARPDTRVGPVRHTISCPRYERRLPTKVRSMDSWSARRSGH